MRVATAVALVLATFVARAAEPVDAARPAVVDPSLDRRKVVVPRIDTEDFEIGLYTGIYSAEDFGSASSKGVRFDYHVTERVFFEGIYGETTISDQLFRQVLPGGIFRNKEEPLIYYDISIGYALFPGETFVTRNWAWSSAVYVTAGLGNTNFAREDHATFVFGLGLRLLPVDWLSLRLDMRDHIFSSDILGVQKTTHNFEFITGIGVYF